MLTIINPLTNTIEEVPELWQPFKSGVWHFKLYEDRALCQRGNSVYQNGLWRHLSLPQPYPPPGVRICNRCLIAANQLSGAR